MREPALRDILRRLGVQVVERKASGWLEASCPFAPWLHGGYLDRRPSFGAKADETKESHFHCFTCHRHGRISSLVRMLHHFDPESVDLAMAEEADRADALGVTSGEFEREPPDPDPEPLEEATYGNVFEPGWEVPGCRAYLLSRNITEAACYGLGLGYDPEQHRVVFPVRGRDGALYGFTGRAINDDTVPKVRDYAGLPKKRLVLGAHRWRGGGAAGGNDAEQRDSADGPRGAHDGGTDAGVRSGGAGGEGAIGGLLGIPRPLLVVEGLFAFAHLISINVEAVADVGALMGNRMTRWKAEIIRDHNAPTFMLVDYDEGGEICLFGPAYGGQRTGGGAVDMLVEHVPLYIPAWPEGKDDPDQLTKKDVWRMLRETRRW